MLSYKYLFYFQADIGQEENFEEVEKKALKFGAKKVSIDQLNTDS